jgi:hypothetical protein
LVPLQPTTYQRVFAQRSVQPSVWVPVTLAPDTTVAARIHASLSSASLKFVKFYLHV